MAHFSPVSPTSGPLRFILCPSVPSDPSPFHRVSLRSLKPLGTFKSLSSFGSLSVPSGHPPLHLASLRSIWSRSVPSCPRSIWSISFPSCSSIRSAKSRSPFHPAHSVLTGPSVPSGPFPFLQVSVPSCPVSLHAVPSLFMSSLPSLPRPIPLHPFLYLSMPSRDPSLSILSRPSPPRPVPLLPVPSLSIVHAVPSLSVQSRPSSSYPVPLGHVPSAIRQR